MAYLLEVADRGKSRKKISKMEHGALKSEVLAHRDNVYLYDCQLINRKKRVSLHIHASATLLYGSCVLTTDLLKFKPSIKTGKKGDLQTEVKTCMSSTKFGNRRL